MGRQSGTSWKVSGSIPSSFTPCVNVVIRQDCHQIDQLMVLAE